MVQEQKARSKGTRKGQSEAEEVTATSSSKGVSEAAGRTIEEIDDVLEDLIDEEILSELDDVLEENAVEFVENYVQQGGQ